MFETLVNNKITIRLCDTQGNKYYLPQAAQNEGEESKQQLVEVPVTLLFNQDARPLRQSHPGFDQAAYIKKTLARDSEKKPFFKINDLNSVSFRIPPESTPHVNETDNSLIDLEVFPEKIGSFQLHILIGIGKGSVEISGSPFRIEIHKSEVHQKLQEERKQQEDAKLERKRQRDEEMKQMKLKKEEQLR